MPGYMHTQHVNFKNIVPGFPVRLVIKCEFQSQLNVFTLELIKACINASKDIIVEGAVRGEFVSTCVMPKHDLQLSNQVQWSNT